MNAARAEPATEAHDDPIYVGGQPVTPPLSMQVRRAGGVGPYLCAEASKPGVLDNVQRGLQAIGMLDQGIVGAIADLVNAGIDWLRGDEASAGLGVLAALPLVGNLLGGANQARKAAHGLQAAADKARDAQKATEAAAAGKKCVAPSTKTDALKKHILNGELDAARREAAGEVVARKANGQPWDHVTELRGAQNGLLKRIRNIKRDLGNPMLDPATRTALEQELGEASKLLDKTEEFLPR